MKPRSRQLKLIADMQLYVIDDFDGDTLMEAAIFIDEHLEEYQIKKGLGAKRGADKPDDGRDS